MMLRGALIVATSRRLALIATLAASRAHRPRLPAVCTVPPRCTWLVRLAAVALLLSLALFWTPERASACLCKEFPSAEDMLARSAAVFAGRVVNMSDPVGSYDPAAGYYRVVELRVSRVWKGEPFSTIFLVDPTTSCTANFREGGQYLVYAYRIAEDDTGSSTLTGSLATNACSRPGRLQDAQADIDVLGEGRLPEAGLVTSVPGEATPPDPPAPGEALSPNPPVPDEATSPDPPVRRWAMGLVAGAIALAALGLLYVRRTRMRIVWRREGHRHSDHD